MTAFSVFRNWGCSRVRVRVSYSSEVVGCEGGVWGGGAVAVPSGRNRSHCLRLTDSDVVKAKILSPICQSQGL